MPLSNCHDLPVVYGLVEMGEKPKVLRFKAGDAELPSGLLNQLNGGWIFVNLWLDVQIGRALNTYMESCLSMGDLEPVTFPIMGVETVK